MTRREELLVLRRKEGERLLLADGMITIQVLAVEGDRVKLGIEAPPEVTIVREEWLAKVGVEGEHDER